MGNKLDSTIDEARTNRFGDSIYGPAYTSDLLLTSDMLHGHLYANLHRDRAKFVAETEQWLRFDSNAGWVPAEPGHEFRLAKEVVAYLQDVARQHDSGSDARNTVWKTSRALGSRTRQQNMIAMARHEDDMTVRASRLDANPCHVGVENGVFDLEQMKLLPITASQLVTKRAGAAYDPEARAPHFERFIAEILTDDAVRNFVQQLFGSMLYGKVEHQRFAFFHGSGSNGKSTLVEIMQRVFGGYAQSLKSEALMRGNRNDSGPDPELMKLRGARFAFANETAEGSKLDDSRVKQLTGGDTLTARDLYAKVVTWEPSHTLVISGNHKPAIHDDSHGMWRRVLLVEFDQTIPQEKQDRQLRSKLEGEAAGILNWLLQGWQQYREQGLAVPDSVWAATKAYREDMDLLGEWIAESFEQKEGEKSPKADVYQSYERWCKANGHHVQSSSKLTRRLKDRGTKLDPGKRHYLGIRAKPQRVDQ